MLLRMLGCAFVLSCWCVGTKAQSCAQRPGEKAAVADTIRAMYADAMKNDIAAFDKLIEPGFYMFDGGQRFDGDAIMKLMAAQYAKGYVYAWTVNEPDVRVSCDEAWIAYMNRGSLTSPDGTVTPMSWLESAMLHREGHAWKLEFFHSTRVPSATPPE